jgi:type IV secretion system protein VirD4
MKLLNGINRWYLFQVIKILLVFYVFLQLGIFIFKVISHLKINITIFNLWHVFSIIQYYPNIFHELILSLFCSFGATCVIIFVYLISSYHPDKTILGDAHFASAWEAKKAGFFESEGIIVGKYCGSPIVSGGFEHVLTFAPAGSGKTTAIAIPNLLMWKESCVVNDPKFELFNITSGYRKNTFQNDVFLWAPTKTKTHRYNPLQFISTDKHKRIGEIQLIAHTIIPNGQGEPIWYQSSRELFLALILYLIDSDEISTLPNVYVISKRHRFNEWLTDLVENTTHLDPEFYRNASSCLNTAEKTRASILKTFTGYLEIFSNPVINAAVSNSDFDLRELRKKKMTIYIGFSENEKEMISPLLTIFWQQLISFMTTDMPTPKTEPYAVLCLMEEFSILGRLVNLKSSLKILRGYRVRVLIIIQYLAQVLEHYSKAEGEAFKNIKTKVVFALDSLDDAEYVSKLLGMRTKRVTQRSQSVGSNNNSSSHSHHLQAVPLMRPEEIQRLRSNDAIVIRTGHSPVKAKQYRWYRSIQLKKLPCGVIAVPEQKPVIIPFEKSNDFERADEKSNKTISDLEAEKMKIQAEFLTGAVLNALQGDQ